jgi:hypothetical protein
MALLHSNRCTAGSKVHTNFANESACLMADNVQNEVVTINRSQEMLKMLSLYMSISFAVNCFFKKTWVQQSLHLQNTRHQLLLDGAGLRGLDVDSVTSSSDYFAYLYIPASETMLHQKRINCLSISPPTTGCRNQLQK